MLSTSREFREWEALPDTRPNLFTVVVQRKRGKDLIGVLDGCMDSLENLASITCE